MQIDINLLPLHCINYLAAKIAGVAVVWQGSAFTIFTKDPDADQIVWDPVSDEQQCNQVVGECQSRDGGQSFLGETSQISSLRHAIFDHFKSYRVEVPNDLVFFQVSVDSLVAGIAMDYAICKALGHDIELYCNKHPWNNTLNMYLTEYSPSTKPNDGYPILLNNGIGTSPSSDKQRWDAQSKDILLGRVEMATGKDILEAGMRCFLKCRRGMFVDIPFELL